MSRTVYMSNEGMGSDKIHSKRLLLFIGFLLRPVCTLWKALWVPLVFLPGFLSYLGSEAYKVSFRVYKPVKSRTHAFERPTAHSPSNKSF